MEDMRWKMEKMLRSTGKLFHPMSLDIYGALHLLFDFPFPITNKSRIISTLAKCSVLFLVVHQGSGPGPSFTPSWQEELSRQSMIWWRILLLSKPVFLLTTQPAALTTEKS